MRQALAGMLWSKQYFYYDLETWLEEHGAGPTVPAAQRRRVRNAEWLHMYHDDIISMPDKWEYPWFAAWDLAFHMLPFMIVDGDFAKEQLDLMLRNDYLHPNGRIPAYEWNFSDVNPPVHAYATIQNYLFDKARNEGKGDVEFLKYASKLLVNFTWWVNRKDRAGNNCFEGGFLGLDNIGVFDRSAPLPTGGYLDQADGTSVDGLLQSTDAADRRRARPARPFYEEYVEKFFQHTIYIAGAMDRLGTARAMGRRRRLLLRRSAPARRLGHAPEGRSMVGLLPLAAVAVFEEDILARMPRVRERMRTFIRRHPELCAGIHMPSQPGVADRRMVSIVNEHKLRRILTRMLDENEFFGPYGIRALSRSHLEHPFFFHVGGQGTGWRTCPAIPTRACSAVTQLARPGMDAGQSRALNRAVSSLCLLRRRFHGRMSDRLREHDDASRGRP